MLCVTHSLRTPAQCITLSTQKRARNKHTHTQTHARAGTHIHTHRLRARNTRTHTQAHERVRAHTHTHSRLLKNIGIFAEYRLFDRTLLQKRPMILRSLLIVATPYPYLFAYVLHTLFSHDIRARATATPPATHCNTLQHTATHIATHF